MSSAPTTIQEVLGILLVPLNPETELDVYRGLQATLEAKAKAEAKGISHLQQDIENEEEQIRLLEHDLDAILRASTAEQVKINESINIADFPIPSIETGDPLLPSLDKVSKTLESFRNGLSREISDLEEEEAAIASIIADQQEQLDLLERQANDITHIHDPLQDDTILKMNFYNSLGIKVENVNGKDTILMYNGNSTSLLTVPEDQTEYDISNHIWDRL